MVITVSNVFLLPFVLKLSDLLKNFLRLRSTASIVAQSMEAMKWW